MDVLIVSLLLAVIVLLSCLLFLPKKDKIFNLSLKDFKDRQDDILHLRDDSKPTKPFDELANELFPWQVFDIIEKTEAVRDFVTRTNRKNLGQTLHILNGYVSAARLANDDRLLFVLLDMINKIKTRNTFKSRCIKTIKYLYPFS